MKPLIEQVLEVINSEINPILKLHNGSCELLGLEDGILTVRLNGGCVGCPSSKITLLNGILPILQERFPEIQDVVLG